MMEEELGIPTQTHSDPTLPAAPPFLQANSRKRSARSYELQDDDGICAMTTSSDPALFSSDETPDAENYSNKRKRHKRKYKGTWWGSQHLKEYEKLGKGQKKREFTRNFDSGIFMGSDDASTDLSSDSSFGMDLIENQAAFKAAAKKTQESTASEMRRKFTAQVSHAPVPAPTIEPPSRCQFLDSNQRQVQDIVRKCLEDGKEDIDLSGLALHDTPLDLAELTTMVKVGAHTGGQEPHDSLEAYPRLYLGNNALRQFPTTILDLTNLRLLSLRQNKLTSLPAGIRSLVHLQTLNISGNKLRYLPWEVLRLIQFHWLREIISEPNPWMEEEFIENVSQSMANGKRLPAVPKPNIVKTKAPHLSEVVLRQLAKVNVPRTNLKSIMPPDTSVQVLDMLQSLHDAQVNGGLRCGNRDCDRVMVVPRWQWIEWWDVKVEMGFLEDRGFTRLNGPNRHREHQVLPFQRNTCGQCYG